ncbi:hypothetical protein CEXT_470011 [Caerostris extrusa]|uniref:Uncharacterized protein n=1 Tax=Caerostris extrusa TaxID=172846 RepID=A0AAV4NTH2_CAEEX|nr:hypothetical protein CEXT_470011 [Caerostris extrusa]
MLRRFHDLCQILIHSQPTENNFHAILVPCSSCVVFSSSSSLRMYDAKLISSEVATHQCLLRMFCSLQLPLDTAKTLRQLDMRAQ